MRIFEQSSNTSLHENTSSGCSVVPKAQSMDGRTEGHEKANNRFWKFCE